MYLIILLHLHVKILIGAKRYFFTNYSYYIILFFPNFIHIFFHFIIFFLIDLSQFFYLFHLKYLIVIIILNFNDFIHLQNYNPIHYLIRFKLIKFIIIIAFTLHKQLEGINNDIGFNSNLSLRCY